MSPAPHPKKTAKPDARALALDLIAAVLHKDQMLDAALSAAEREKGGTFNALEPRDRAFARLITATVLRRLGQIDATLADYLKRPLGEKGARVHDILRLSIAQLIFLDTPPHAAVDAAVNLTRAEGYDPLAGLVNGVLRKLVRDGKAGIEKQDAPRLNTPYWLWKSWISAYGEETTRAIARVHLADPPLDFTIRDNPALWAEKLGGVVLPTGSVRVSGGGQVREMAGYDEGTWWVQDAASALPVRLLGNVQGKRVADLCAAPGGKTAQLAAGGAQITAIERSKKRLVR
ncbi:MAG: MFS transporter, partial [Alphaproteobacteria bacterium]|nr:MFS transporter [Alphaproteobacteria bacterium]